MEAALTCLLLLQAALGGIDTLYNHEHLLRLRARPESAAEVGLHAIRETIYAALFAVVPWWHWNGWIAAWIPLLILCEIAVTLADERIENETRVLPANERLLHVALTVNVGALLALGIAHAVAQWGMPASLEMREAGWPQAALMLFAMASITWAGLDALAWREWRASSRRVAGPG